jgi:hypothetical protein
MVDITPKDRPDWDEDEPESTARLREVEFSCPAFQFACILPISRPYSWRPRRSPSIGMVFGVTLVRIHSFPAYTCACHIPMWAFAMQHVNAPGLSAARSVCCERAWWTRVWGTHCLKSSRILERITESKWPLWQVSAMSSTISHRCEWYACYARATKGLLKAVPWIVGSSRTRGHFYDRRAGTLGGQGFKVECAVGNQECPL